MVEIAREEERLEALVSDEDALRIEFPWTMAELSDENLDYQNISLEDTDIANTQALMQETADLDVTKLNYVEDRAPKKIKDDLEARYKKNCERWRPYHEEVWLSCESLINAVHKKIIDSFNIIKPYVLGTKLAAIYSEKLKQITDKTESHKKEISSMVTPRKYNTFNHNDRMKELTKKINAYEYEVLTITNNLIKYIKENYGFIQKEKQDNKTYFIKEWWKYKLTNAVNTKKAKDLLWSTVKTWELWMIDYSKCKNGNIKNKYGNWLHLFKKDNDWNFYIQDWPASWQPIQIWEWVEIEKSTLAQKEFQEVINIVNQLDSPEKIKNNIWKLAQVDWGKLYHLLPGQKTIFINNVQRALTKIVHEDNLYNKCNKTDNELKILFLRFWCDEWYKPWKYDWDSYKKIQLPLQWIKNWTRDEWWIKAQNLDKIPQKYQETPVVKPRPVYIDKAGPGWILPIIEEPTPEVGTVKVDENENLREWSIKEILDKITKWARDTYNSRYLECESAARNKYMRQQSEIEIDMHSYIKYELYLFSFSKYCEAINGKHNDIISLAWYETADEYEKQMRLVNNFQETIWNKYDKIWDIINDLEKYTNEVEKNKDKYFKWKSDNYIQDVEKKYTEFQSFQQKTWKENWITEQTISSINKTPESPDEMQKYWENLGKILRCQDQVIQKKEEYWNKWDIIDKYDWYVKWMLKIKNKYAYLDFSTLTDYNNIVEHFKLMWLDFDKYGEYSSLMQKKWLGKHLKNMSLIQSVLMDETSKEFPISKVRDIAIEKELKRKRIDETRQYIKEQAPVIYRLDTVMVWLWNWFVDATIWVGTSLWAMILAGGSRDKYEYQLKRKEKWDNFFKIDQSSSQKMAVYDPTTKSFNFHLDNTVSTVSSSVAQMFCLIYWWWAAGKWIGRLWASAWIGMSEQLISRAWLFSMSFITQLWWSYQEAMQWWLSWAWAFAYSIISAWIQSWLELISPNEVLLWKWSWLWKELVTSLCGSWNRWMELVWKYFLTTVWKEILEENLQEWLQLAAWNLINDIVNGIWNTSLDSDWNAKNFLSTAIITTLTTWITTGFSAWKRSLEILRSDHPKLMNRIINDPWLYEDTMKVIDDYIEGNLKLPPEIKIEQVQALKGSLEDLLVQNITNNDKNDVHSNTKDIQNMKEWDIKDLIEWKWVLQLENLSANDLRLLMFKACNMWLDFKIITELRWSIEDVIIHDSKMDTSTKTELQNYISHLSYVSEIQNINIEGDPLIVENNLNNIQQEIVKLFGENSVSAKELGIEINKKKFELYKKTWNIEQAEAMVDKIWWQSRELLSNDVKNFRYRRWLLEANLLEIQLWWDRWKNALADLTRHAQEVRDKTETIWSRTDTETLISRIESWIILWKTTEQLQPYLDFLALAEHWAGVNILWTVIETINTTFDSDWAKGVLEKYANDVTDAWKKLEDSHLLEAWNKANTISEKYNQMKKDLDNDPNKVHKKEVESRLDKFIKERSVSSISDVWNNFSHFTVLLNPQATQSSPVMSIEIWKVDYETAYNTLKAEFQENKIDLEWDIWDYNTFIANFNKIVDNWIRTNFWTEKLQELHSSEHRALFDYIAAKYMESRRWDQNASLTNLSQLFSVKWLQDCRLHAFTKQLFFDAWKTNKLNSLEQSKSSAKSDTEIAKINREIQLIENTKMVFMDAEFSWNVDMNAKYVARTQNWHMVAWSQNNVIEEHTFNLLEMPELDAEWNIQYEDVLDGTWQPTGAKKVKTKVCFADSFYQWSREGWFDTGKVYDLSYTWEDISKTIYWKKWEDVYMETTATDANWNTIDIKVKPLSRSIQWRWDNITWSSIETRWPDAGEVARLNNQYDEWVEIVETLRKNRTEIKENFQNILTALEAWQPVSLKAVEKALISSDWHKVAEWQANQIKRAIEDLWKVPESERWKALTAIQTMINNTVTQNIIDFTWAKGDATEFLQTEWVFFNAMQIFNDVYKAEIEEARKNLDPNNPKSVKKLQDAIKRYQEIYDRDMKDFFERFSKQIERELKVKEEKWWNIDGYQAYDRNNFEQAAKRFNEDMKVYAEAVKSLENAWKFKEAREIKKYMLDQRNILLNHSDELLWHMIDFKKVKKEMKGLKWREIYNQLKEIQSKNIINIETELKRNWLNRDYIKGMTWLEENLPLSKENLEKAIHNIEDSWLTDYYYTISLVFNPELLAIDIENTVYSSNPVYTSETEDWRIFATETEEEYIARKERELKVEKNINKNTQSKEIQKICDWIVDSAIQKISNWNEASQIKTTISELIKYCRANWIKWKAMYDLCKISTEVLVFQTIESKTRSMGDHWINHISWNIQKLNTYLEVWAKAWRIPSGEIWKYKLMWILTHIFHDIWYAAFISKWSNNFDGSAIHPFTSEVFFDGNVKNILENAKINTKLVCKAIESHDGIRLNWGSPESTFLSMVNLSDNMALWVDKISEIWTNPHLLKHISTLYALDAAWLDLKKTHEIMIKEIDGDTNLNENQRETLKSAIKEISSFSMGNVDFWSISPLTAMNFNERWVPTLSMFQWTNIMLVAEVCGINRAELEQAIENKDRAAIIKIMEWPDKKWTKFCSQIIKPLWDYSDIYSIHDAKWNEYEKIEKKKDWKTYMEYNWNVIKADLLLGETITLKDWNSEVLHYRYEWSTKASRQAEQNSVYWSIDMAEMLWDWVKARNNLRANDIAKELGSINKSLKKVEDSIKKLESIGDINVLKTELDWAYSRIYEITVTPWVTINDEVKTKVDNLKNNIDSFKNILDENNYEVLKTETENLINSINELWATLIIMK